MTSTGPATRGSVLLVDDRPDNLSALQAMLAGLGHEIVTAPSGEEALRLLLDRDFAVVLLGVHLPGLDGLATARLIRGRPRSRHTPLLFLTASDRVGVEQAYALGAVDHLVEPLLPVVVRAKVAGFVELFVKAEQARAQAELLREMERGEQQRRLAEEDARFRALTEHNSDAVSLVAADGTVLYTSPSGRRLLGYGPDELLGRNGLELVHPADLDRVRGRLAEVAGTPGTAGPVELRARHKDGSWRWVECVATNLLGEPAVRAVVVNVRDITERQRASEALRESEGRFARFMQHLPGLAWIKDLQGRYVYANDAAARAFRVSHEGLSGKTDDEVFPPATAAQFKENDRRALAGGAGVRVVETLEDEAGTLRHSIVSKFPIPGPDGEPAAVGGMAIDITDRVELEAALRQADRRKDEFLAMLAHELRNPLAPVRAALQVLRAAGSGHPDADQAAAMIERQVWTLARLVDDLLDVSRITRGKVRLRKEPVDLAVVVARAVEAARPLLEANRHALEVSLPEGPVPLEADATRLEQVFANLLNNAAKYTEPGGSVRLSAERRGGEVVVRVRDSGCGIPAEVLPHVFDLFTQADRTLDRSQGGLGVGLTLVKGLVEMHGGSVAAHSDGPGQGSELVVCLPAGPATGGRGEPEGRPATPRPLAPARRLRVLVVDDNRDAAVSLAMLLRLWGHEARTAHDGPSALKAALSYRPEVVLLDIGLPGPDGYEVARRLRAVLSPAAVRLVAVTGYGQEEDRRRSREAGFDAHLVKPAALDELYALLAEGGGTT
jgi:PAS domain S-box-containing protein